MTRSCRIEVNGQSFSARAGDILLDAALINGVDMPFDCRSGNCGSCLVAIKSGQVDYLGGHGAEAEAGSCLACICKPRGNLVIDA